MRWLLALLLFLPASASAQATETAPDEETAPGEETAPDEETLEVGVIDVLRDRTGGTLSPVRKISREVEVVRVGEEFKATPGLVLRPGDAVRTGQGVLAVQASDGRRLEVGERSQVRFEPDKALLRLGTLLVETSSPFAIEVGESTVTSRGGVLLVRADSKGLGILQVFEGSADISDGKGTRSLGPLETTEIGGNQQIQALTPTSRNAVLAERASQFSPPGEQPRGTVASPDRAHVIVAGGITRLDRDDFGAIDLSTRIRIAGPAWVHAAVSLILRPADELAGYDTVLALPTRFGVRFMAELPRSVFIEGGADFSLLFGERCTSLDGCPRAFSVEPGGWLSVGVGLYIHKRIGIQIELGGGLHRRRLPPAAATGGELIFPELQAQGLIGVFVRI